MLKGVTVQGAGVCIVCHVTTVVLQRCRTLDHIACFSEALHTKRRLK